ncbi:MAG: serine hydrolase domain-containing protein [Pseudomonadota bacterium]
MLTASVGQQQIMGAAFCVGDKNGTLYEGAVGKSAENGVSMSGDSVVRIYSMTKAVTGVAAMQLVEQGRLDLDAPAGDVCPYLGEIEVFMGFDTDGRPQMRPPSSPVTLRNLLTHSSGFVYDIWNDEFAEYAKVMGVPSIAAGQKASLTVPLMFDPGSRWEYGIGIDWVGQMVECVSGMSLGEYLEAHVTGPLGMRNTAFRLSEEMQTSLASMHHRQEDQSLAAAEDDGDDISSQPEFELGGGGLFSTANDYIRFVQMLLRGGELDGQRILQSRTIDLMAQNHIGDLRVNELVSNLPSLSNNAELFPGEPKSWGLTFQINESNCATGRSAGTLMWAGLSNCYFWVDRVNEVGGVFVTQIFPFADHLSLELFYNLEKAVYQSL